MHLRTFAPSHLRTFALLVFTFVLSTKCLGQTYGNLTFSGVSHFNGKTEVVVNWVSIPIPNSVKQVNLPINISGEICNLEVVNQNPFFQYAVNGNQVTIQKTSSQAYSLSQNYASLLTLRFGSKENELVTVQGANQFHIVTALNQFRNVDVSSVLNYTPAAYTVSGLIQKAEGVGTPCSGGINNGIPGSLVEYLALTSCVPGIPTMDVSPDGTHSRALREQVTYRIRVKKNSGCACGVDEDDAILITNFILGGGEPATGFQKLFQWLAADFDADNIISTSDVSKMQSCELGNWTPPPGWESWIFIPTNAYLLHTNNYPPPYTAQYVPNFVYWRNTPPLTYNLVNQDFYGIKRGDLTQNCSDCNGTNFQGDPDDRSVTVENLEIADRPVIGGEIIDIPIHTSIAGDVSVFGLELEVDPAYIEVLDYSGPDGDISGDFASLSGDNQEKLTVFWIGSRPARIKNELLTLRCRILKDAPSLRALIWQNKSKLQNVAYLGNDVKVSFDFPRKIGVYTSDFDAKLITSAAISDELELVYHIPKNEEVRIYVSDAKGIQKGFQTVHLEKEIDRVQVGINLIETGVYFYTIESSVGVQSGKFVKL